MAWCAEAAEKGINDFIGAHADKKPIRSQSILCMNVCVSQIAQELFEFDLMAIVEKFCQNWRGIVKYGIGWEMRTDQDIGLDPRSRYLGKMNSRWPSLLPPTIPSEFFPQNSRLDLGHTHSHSHLRVHLFHRLCSH